MPGDQAKCTGLIILYELKGILVSRQANMLPSSHIPRTATKYLVLAHTFFISLELEYWRLRFDFPALNQPSIAKSWNNVTESWSYRLESKRNNLLSGPVFRVKWEHLTLFSL